MKLVKQNIEAKDGSGTATLLPEEPEDMWHAYNLIRPTDLLRASAVRRVTTESTTGSTSSSRVHTTLTLRENKHVKLGSYHTLDLELQRAFTLEKADGWDSIAVGILREAIDQTAKAELWAVVMQEGLANICVITTHQTIPRQRVEGVLRFFATVLETLVRQVDLKDPKPVLLASPGFTAAAFRDYMKSEATQKGDKALMGLVNQVIVAHSASGHLHALNEVLASPAVTTRLADTRFARETGLMDRFFDMLRKDDGRAWYGPKEVERAVEKGAVGRGGGVLLISNALFRAQDVAVRKRWVTLVDKVRDEEGGEVRVLSSMHESGKRLEGLGGIAAILTFPIEDLEGEDEVNGGEEGAEIPERTGV
ncbi:Translation factor pelota [Taxawa tesnikishii (nom. ined.)]|nr:Translation factor pelota [Dothideales sp. JES 119]